MYGVLTAQRGARAAGGAAAAAPDDGFALDLRGRARAAAGGRRGLAVRPQQPDRRARGARRPSRPSWTPAPGCPGGGPVVVVDEAYIEFQPGLARAACATATRASSSCARSPRPSPCRACAWATRWRPAPTIARLERVRPPGSVSTVSATVAARGPAPPGAGAPPTPPRCAAERDWLAGAAGGHGPAAVPERHQLPARALRRRTARRRPPTEHLLRRGIVPRTFGPATRCAGTCASRCATGAQDERLVEVLGAWMDGRTA